MEYIINVHIVIILLFQECNDEETVGCIHHLATDIIAMLTERLLMISNSFVIEKLLNALDKENISTLLYKSSA